SIAFHEDLSEAHVGLDGQVDRAVADHDVVRHVDAALVRAGPVARDGTEAHTRVDLDGQVIGNQDVEPPEPHARLDGFAGQVLRVDAAEVQGAGASTHPVGAGLRRGRSQRPVVVTDSPGGYEVVGHGQEGDGAQQG